MVKINWIPIFFVIFGNELLCIEAARLSNQASSSATSSNSGKCELNAGKDIPQPDPLLVEPGRKNFYNPNREGIIEIEQDKTIDLYCDSTFKEFPNINKISAKCLGGKTFLANEGQYSFSKFKCSDWQTIVVRRTGKNCGIGDAKLLEVGFNLQNSEFIFLYAICHDDILESTLYVHHWLKPSAKFNYKTWIKRIPFEQLDFFSVRDTNSLYTTDIHPQTVNTILNSDEFIDIPKKWFLSRGHLTSRTDYIYPSQQRATFLLLNVAPQWQEFNGKNWDQAEQDVRNYAGNNNIDLEIYTGTFGISTLPDVNKVPRKLFLNLDPDNINHKIPVPAFYYKLVIDPASGKGIALIGINNIHLNEKDILENYILCDNISYKVSWIHWDATNIKHGFSYACDPTELIKIIDHLPKLKFKGLLL